MFIITEHTGRLKRQFKKEFVDPTRYHSKTIRYGKTERKRLRERNEALNAGNGTAKTVAKGIGNRMKS